MEFNNQRFRTVTAVASIFFLLPTDQKDQTAFSRLLLQFNGENNNDQVTAYIDNIFIHR